MKQMFKAEELRKARNYYIDKCEGRSGKKVAWIAAIAIDKQIPMKVKYEHPYRNRCTCPTCIKPVDEFKKINGGRDEIRTIPDYCPYCGQALEV